MKIKPFDLEKALSGEPVVLKNGYKAYVIKQMDHKETVNDDGKFYNLIVTL